MREELQSFQSRVPFELKNKLLRVRALSAALPAFDERLVVVQLAGRVLLIGAGRVHALEGDFSRHDRDFPKGGISELVCASAMKDIESTRFA